MFSLANAPTLNISYPEVPDPANYDYEADIDGAPTSESSPSLDGYPSFDKFSIETLFDYLRKGGEISLHSARTYLPADVLKHLAFGRDIVYDRTARHTSCELLRLRPYREAGIELPERAVWQNADFQAPQPTLKNYPPFPEFGVDTLVRYLSQGGNLTQLDAYESLPQNVLEHPYFQLGLIDSREARAPGCGNLYLTDEMLSQLSTAGPGDLAGPAFNPPVAWSPAQIAVLALAVWGGATVTAAFMYAAWRKVKSLYSAPGAETYAQLVEDDDEDEDRHLAIELQEFGSMKPTQV
ncbi:hypothetical protein GT347_17215 [Xylophilus rhododendri]|uniref:Uncharacterized protein n=1 Tax=Xylophilus rhododendri TaxID=2697032 RepID=A0A857J9X6_9BURK|nr:hypothetical protein [Xylophilus rhododendri]QHI99558.1 hypothetical protein GT347_17215 [Xylophilus rhododendri]